MAVAIACFPMGTICWACDSSQPHNPDGWLRTGLDGHRTYCTTECLEDWETQLAREERHRTAQWCPACGYDNYEHSPTCADGLAHQRERAERPDLYS